MTSLSLALKEHGLKATAPRLAVLEALGGESGHAPRSAQDIHAALMKNAAAKKSGMDLVTVYRTLASFEKAGIVKRVDLRGDSVLYELNDEHHHHIVCTNCGTVEDFEMCDMEALTKKIAQKSKKFTTIREHTLELFGVCTQCVIAK